MAIFKCKMCGGALEISEDITVAECEYCGSKQTVPTKKDEVITNLFNRANNLRLKSEFDKAAEVYSKILNENDADAEAHWGLVLCKYGIEYVEDPKTYKRIPTCHRTQYTSVLSDTDYLAAIENADVVSKEVYTAEAHEIAELQKSILAIVKDEKPFDVFICYKETDENGKRTVDSTLANDIYYQLTKEGLRVFYAAITLEDKLGVEYEPYIFAALNSAKVMLAIGTKPEYFSAVWVRNEWSRYLGIMKTDREKMLIPCYRDMDAYDLPEEFAHLQAQDMSKIGFINDLVRGIKKVTVKDAPNATENAVKETVVKESSNGNIDALLKRGFMALEDGEWSKADDFFEQVLNFNAELADAYLGKLMAELGVKNQGALKDQAEPFDKSNNYQKVLRFGDESLKSMLVSYIDHINTRNENARLEGIYKNAKKSMVEAKSEVEYLEAAECFESVSQYKDSIELAKECRDKAEVVRKDAILFKGKERMSYKEVYHYEAAIKILEIIPGWKDADELIIACQKRIEKLNAEAEQERIELEKTRKKILKISKIVIPIVSVAIIVAIFINNVIIPNGKYKDALALVENGKYLEAIAIFETLDDYKDSADKIVFCETAIETAILDGKYNEAVALMENDKFDEAISAFKELDGYKDSENKINDIYYENAQGLLNDKKYAEAAIAFGKIGDYKDASEKSFELWNKISIRKSISTLAWNTAALKLDGTVVSTQISELYDYGQCNVANWANIIDVSVGERHTVGLKSDGTVIALGENSYGECNVDNWTDIVAISAGYFITLGLKSDGTVVATGWNQYGQCSVNNWTDVVAISAGDRHSVGLKYDGTVLAVGSNEDGRCNIDSWKNIVSISAGFKHTVGLRSDGTVVSVGDNENSQCNTNKWKNIVDISAGTFSTVGIKSDGTVVSVGEHEFNSCDVSEWTDIVAVSAGSFCVVGLKSNGTVVTTRIKTDYDYGQCDVDGWKNIKTPTK